MTIMFLVLLHHSSVAIPTTTTSTRLTTIMTLDDQSCFDNPLEHCCAVPWYAGHGMN
jgi:hypothetical protein